MGRDGRVYHTDAHLYLGFAVSLTLPDVPDRLKEIDWRGQCLMICYRPPLGYLLATAFLSSIPAYKDGSDTGILKTEEII